MTERVTCIANVDENYRCRTDALFKCLVCAAVLCPAHTRAHVTDHVRLEEWRRMVRRGA